MQLSDAAMEKKKTACSFHLTHALIHAFCLVYFIFLYVAMIMGFIMAHTSHSVSIFYSYLVKIALNFSYVPFLEVLTCNMKILDT